MNTHHHHRHNHDRSDAFVLGIVLNTVFVLAEIAYGFKAHSLALLADAGHNASDVLGLLMAWSAIRLAARPASAQFTYGLQSASIAAALGNALLLLIAVGGIGWEVIQRLMQPEAPMASTVMAVAGAGVLINGATAFLFRHGGHDLNVRGAFLHMMGDAAVSLGVVLSGAAILWTGWLWLDPLIGLLIILVILCSAVPLLVDSVRLSLHAVPRHIDAAQVSRFLQDLSGVAQIHDLHIWAMSTTGVALSAHLLMPGGHPGDAFIRNIAHELNRRFRIDHATLQIELGDNVLCDSDCHDGESPYPATLNLPG